MSVLTRTPRNIVDFNRVLGEQSRLSSWDARRCPKCGADIAIPVKWHESNYLPPPQADTFILHYKPVGEHVDTPCSFLYWEIYGGEWRDKRLNIYPGTIGGRAR